MAWRSVSTSCSSKTGLLAGGSCCVVIAEHDSLWGETGRQFAGQKTESCGRPDVHGYRPAMRCCSWHFRRATSPGPPNSGGSFSESLIERRAPWSARAAPKRHTRSQGLQTHSRHWQPALWLGLVASPVALLAVHVVVFWFLVCYAATQLATQLPQRRIQVVCSNGVARKRSAESNGTPAMDPGHTNIDIDLMYTFACCCEMVQTGYGIFFLVSNPQASAPITSGTHTDGGAVIRKPGSAWLEGTPAISIIFMF